MVLLRPSNVGPSRDSEHPYALLRGSAVNQDGRSSSLTAPSGPAQTALISSVLRAAGAHTAIFFFVWTPTGN